MSDEPTERDVEALIRRGPFEWGAGDDDSWATLWPTSERDDPLRVILLGLDEDIEQVCVVLNGYAERIAEARREGAAEVAAKVEALADEWESTETIWPSVPRRLRAALRGDA